MTDHEKALEFRDKMIEWTKIHRPNAPKPSDIYVGPRLGWNGAQGSAVKTIAS